MSTRRSKPGTAIEVIADRYGGVYSGGRWLALMTGRAPSEDGRRDGPLGDDLSAATFWRDPPSWIAAGDTPDDARSKLRDRSAGRRWTTMDIAIGLYILCFACGTAMHARGFLLAGWRPYRWAGLPIELFWSSLIVLDLAVILLLATGRRRAGLLLAVAVMVSDVAINSYAAFGLRITMVGWAMLAQACFLGFVLGSVGFLWPARTRV